MAAVAVSSASGLLSLLDEDDESLKLYALQSLNKIVHEFWFQIASQQAIASVEAFYEDEGFSHRELAALVASKAGSRVLLPCNVTKLTVFGMFALGVLSPGGAGSSLDICPRGRKFV